MDLDREGRFLFWDDSRLLRREFSLDLDLDLPLLCVGLLGDLCRFLFDLEGSLSADLLRGCDLDRGDLDLSLVGLEQEGAD